MHKSYGQFCALARALDHIGDRWTLLIVRELLVRASTYGELEQALAGVPTNLLAARLRQLRDDGLVTRQGVEGDGRRVSYALTPLGAGLEPAVHALVRWGSHWMRSGPGDDRFDPRWAGLALRALLEQRVGRQRGTVVVRLGDESIEVASRPGARLRVRQSAKEEPDAVVSGSPGAVLGLVSGELTMTAAARSGLRITGDRSVAQAVCSPAKT